MAFIHLKIWEELKILTDNFGAATIWISSESIAARTDRLMIDRLAQCSGTAQSRAGVGALLLSPTRLCLKTVGVNNALRSAACDWVTLGEALKTLADRDSLIVITVPCNAFGIRSAR